MTLLDKLRTKTATYLLGVSLLAFGCGGEELNQQPTGCKSNIDCKGDRVCYQGECISPELNEDIYNNNNHDSYNNNNPDTFNNNGPDINSAPDSILDDIVNNQDDINYQDDTAHNQEDTSTKLALFGEPCVENNECESGICLPTKDECTSTCIEFCPDGWVCKESNQNEYICFPADYSSEICDGQDNNYDGVIDENLIDYCYNENPIGHCDGEKHCIDGVWTPCDALIPEMEQCDNLDNDCDGLVDYDLYETILCDNGNVYDQFCDGGEWIPMGDCQGNGQFGEPCVENNECESGTCLSTNLYGPICTTSCENECIEDFVCASTNICIPKYDTVGTPCDGNCCHPADPFCDYAICSDVLNSCTVTCTDDCGYLAGWECVYMLSDGFMCMPE